MVNYSVGDFLIQVKNASRAEKRDFGLTCTKFVKAVADVLKKEGILNKVELIEKELNVSLAYHKKKPVLIDLKLVSKPGLRIYVNVDDLKKKRGASFLLLSTEKGVMSSRDALKKNVGGEVIAEIW